MGAFLKQLAALTLGNMAGSNNKAAFIVKTARGIYIIQGGLVAVLWYSAWRNERVNPGEIDFPFPGLSKKKRVNQPDREEQRLAAKLLTDLPELKEVMPNGQVGESISINEPPALRKVVNWCNSVSGKYPYVWGGGHSQIGIPSGGGFDCSGAVSGAVGQLGPQILRTPVTSVDFANIFPSGEGKFITVYGNSAHCFMKIKLNGIWHWFGTGSDKEALRGGVAWGNNDSTNLGEYQASHPPGY